MVLSHRNFNEDIAPVIMGAKLGVGWASAGENTEFLEKLAKRASLLKEFCVTRHYFLKDVFIKDIQLHGFCNASDIVYFGIV